MTPEDEEFEAIAKRQAKKRAGKPAEWLTEERYAQMHTAKREWVGLTDEEIDELHGSPMELEHSGALKWVRIIEAKLKEKNNR